MKARFATALLALFLVLGAKSVIAQVPICQGIAPTDMISNFADWHWDIDRNDPNYCNTWAIRTGNNATGTVYGAPWLHAQNGVLARIAADKDYGPATGWVLLRMDLGGKTPVTTPYFILYNKYTSMIRSYFWLNNSSGTYNNGAVITLSHSSNSRVTPSTSLSANPTLAPDKYINQQKANEIISYVAKMSSQDGWIVGEFTLAFDPYFRDDLYLGSSLQFDVFGTVVNSIQLAGDFNFKTNTEEGFAIAGQKSDVIKPKTGAGGNSLKEFFATGQTILGAVKPEDADKFLGNIHDAGLSLAHSSHTATSNTGLSIANATRPASGGGGLRKTVGAVLGVASNLGPVFGAVGTLIGALWPDDSSPAGPPPFTPTVSKGSISLSGTITTNFPLTGVICQVPGTKHSSDLSTAPYYDCALGLFNIKHELVLNKKTHSDAGSYYTEENTCSDYTTFSSADVYYDSYQVQNDLEGVYNRVAGFELVSAEAALVSDVIFGSQFGGDLANTVPFWQVDGCNDQYFHNYLALEVRSGVVEQIKLGDGSGTLQTPFRPFGCMRGLAFTTQGGAKVYLRVKVILKSTDTTRPQPLVYYVQDYAVAVNDNAAPTNPAFNPNSVTQPPFTNLLLPLSFNDPSSITVAGQFTSPIYRQAMNMMSTGNPTSFTHPIATPSQLLAGNSVAMLDGFSVASGTNFVAATGLTSQRNCGTSLISANNEPWRYNTVAYRIAASDTEGTLNRKILEVFPNPTTGSFSISVSGYRGQARITLLNSLGQIQFSKAVVLQNEFTEHINTSGFAKGIYVLKVTCSEGVITKKVLLQ
jgi:Secretion system C-terminal sorting domain